MRLSDSVLRWRQAGVSLLLLGAGLLMAYVDTLRYLGRLWGDFANSEYAHGYLVLAISAYLIWRERKRLARCEPCPDLRPMPLLVLAVMFWLLAALVDVVTAETLALFMIVFVAVWALLGACVMRLLWFPLGFLLFAIPVWFPLSPLLQNMTADVVFYFIRLFSVPAMRQDNMIVLASGALSIEEACSGLRYLMAALTLGSLYAWLNYRGWLARLTVVLVTAAAAVVANFLRVFIVVYLGYTSNMTDPLVYDHLMMGWYLFGAMMALLLAFDVWLSRYLDLSLTGASDPVCAPCRAGAVKRWGIVAAVVLLVLAGPLLLRYFSQVPAMAASGESPAITLPLQLGAWRAVTTRPDGWAPRFPGAQHLRRDYMRDEAGRPAARASLYLLWYDRQRQGQELINERNRMGGGHGWRSAHERPRRFSLGRLPLYEQLLVHDSGKRRLIWYYYRVAGQAVGNRYLGKLLQAKGLLGGNTRALAVILAVDVDDDAETARKRLSDLLPAVLRSEQESGWSALQGAATHK